MILAALGCEMSPDRDENVFGTNMHTICSVCNSEALFPPLTLEDVDFLVSLSISVVVVNIDHPKLRGVSTVGSDGG